MADYNANIAPFINKEFTVTSEWWEERSYYHKGLDISTGGNDPLFSMFNGTVILKSYDADGYGNYIIIKDSTTGAASLYAHMKSVSVSQGQLVTKGQQVGLEGTTGHSSGNHCHLELQDLSSGRNWIFGGQKSDYMNPAAFMGIPNVEGITSIYNGSPVPVPTEWISKNTYLTQEEMENNALIIINYYRNQGLNDKTIAAILGNMQAESTISPIFEERGGGGGYGLVQWTPQSDLINACNTLSLSPYTSGDIQIEVILAEVTNTPSSIAQWFSSEGFISHYYNSGATSDMVGITGLQFLSNEMNWEADKLAVLFMAAYERPSYDPSINHYQKRMQYALEWWDFMGGVPPVPPVEKRNKWQEYIFSKRKIRFNY